MPPPGPLADRLGLCPSLPGPLTWGSPLGRSGPAQPCPTFRSGKALAWSLLLPSTPDPQSAVLLRLGQCPLAMALPLPPNHPRALHCLPPDPPPFGSIKSQSTLPWPSWHGASSLLPRHPAELTNSLMCQASAQPPLCQGTHGFLSSTWVAQLLKLSPSRCIRMVPTQVLQGLSQCLLRPVSSPAPAPATPNPPWIPSPRPTPAPAPILAPAQALLALTCSLHSPSSHPVLTDTEMCANMHTHAHMARGAACHPLGGYVD